MDNYKQKLMLLCALLLGCVLTSVGVEYFSEADDPVPVPPPAFVEHKVSQKEEANILKDNTQKNQGASLSQNKPSQNKTTVKNREAASERIVAPININTASVAELDSLPGIGPVIAQRIVEHRQVQPFKSIEELMLVKGIGKKKFAKLRELITVE